MFAEYRQLVDLKSTVLAGNCCIAVFLYFCISTIQIIDSLLFFEFMYGVNHFVHIQSGANAFPLPMLVGIGSSEEQYNDAAVAIAFGTFKGQEDHTKALLGDDYYVDALKVRQYGDSWLRN